MKYFLAILLFPLCTPAHADEDYIIGLQTVSVPDFKKDWEAEGNEPLRFPPRTETAVIVADITRYSPAHFAGLQELDIIRVADSKIIKSQDEFAKQLEGFKKEPDKKIKLAITRRTSGRWKGEIIEFQPMKKEDFYKVALEKRGDMVHHRDAEIAVNAYRGFYLFYNKTGERPDGLFLRMTYTDADWLFINKCIIKTGEKNYTLRLGKVYRKSGILMDRVKVWEWADFQISPKDYEMIENMTSVKTTVRYEGSRSHTEYGLERDDQTHLKTVFDSYIHETKTTDSE